MALSSRVVVAATLALLFGLSSASDCEDKGFSTHTLCSDCKHLQEFVEDAALTSECEQCCVKEATSSERRFSKATLEVCQHRLGNYPHLEQFVKQHAADFPALKVAYRWGASPRLTLRGSGGGAGRTDSRKESVRVDQWKTETIVEFLRDKLRGGEDAAAQ